MVLGVMVLSKVILSRVPLHVELSLIDSISEPAEPHIQGLLGCHVFHSVVNNTIDGTVVCLCWTQQLQSHAACLASTNRSTTVSSSATGATAF